MTVRNIKLILEYDGTNYSGWQSQTNGTAIQDVVSKAIQKMVEHTVTVRGASRTDAGVHALAQVAAFETGRTISCGSFLKGLNALLPEDIRVKHCEEVAAVFHPIRDAQWKEYHYQLEIGETPSALNRNRAWWVGPVLDVGAREKASRCRIGEHDFKSFQGPQADTKTTVRRVDQLSLRAQRSNPSLLPGDCFVGLRPPRNDTICLQFIAPGFLKYMIRNIVGTLVEVGQGRRAAGEVKTILESKDRKKAGGCAPACGLYLVQITYGPFEKSSCHPERSEESRDSEFTLNEVKGPEILR
ncbi:MAG: tRNA pseudouridine(38-40) synthase TruA [Deltaproteobacteria bacterium]|nr:tRNA pseudouridine(38-40) synthase TruA [Deltaproteobacteria bacterium]